MKFRHKTAPFLNNTTYFQGNTTLSMGKTAYFPRFMRGIPIIFFILFSTLAWGTGITVEVDAAQIEVGQPIRLTLTYDPREVQGLPDLQVLQNDFTILATEQSTSYTVTNGQARSIGQWGIVLEAKHSGMITIPAIRIGAAMSQPMQVNVNQSSHAPVRARAQDVAIQRVDTQADTALTVSVDNKKPYLNQEILYKVRLLASHRLLDARYQAPQVDDAILFPLGESQQYQTTQDGKNYQVNEQIYAIFPQKSGPLTITPPSLHALTEDFSPQPVTVMGETVTLQVQPLPKQIKRKEWLPSKLVHLKESYEGADTQLTQGATIVRNIELQAQGLVAQLLPEITFPDKADLRIYPEQPERDNRIQQGELWGRYKLKVTYVFPTAGTIVLPAVKLPWFNVKTQKLELAELPSKTYEIKATDSKKQSKPSPLPFPKNKPASTQKTAIDVSALLLKPELRSVLAYLLGFFGIIIGLMYGWKQIRHPLQLRAACLANDVERSKIALLHWGLKQWPQQGITHFTDIMNLLPKQSPLYEALKIFSETVYGESKNSWQGAGLWQAIKQFKKSPRPISDTPATLPPIHPIKRK